MKKDFPSFSIVIETENLGMAGLEDLVSGLQSLQKQTLSPENAREVLIVAGGHVSEDTQELLRKDFPWTKIITPEESLSYTEAKMFGARATTGDIVVFVDSDVHYEPTWLESLLNGFLEKPDASVIAGETIIRGKSIYTHALNLAWMLPTRSRISEYRVTNHVHLNNMAVRRNVILSLQFQPPVALYRAQLPFWIQGLIKDGHKAYRAPHARGRHAPPQDFFDWWYRMLIFGADFVARADFMLRPPMDIVEKKSIVKRFLRCLMWTPYRIFHLIKRTYFITIEDPLSIWRTVIALPVAIFFLIIMQIGALIALFNRDYLLKKITARETEHVV